MREIKFRGRDDLTGNGWVYGDFSYGYYGNQCLVDEISVVEKTVGQYTGLKDCKGQEIFEGDILRYLPPWRWVDTKRIGVVVFEDYSFYVKNKYTTDLLFNIAVNSDGAPFEVIGNVHDNPEFLEVEA